MNFDRRSKKAALDAFKTALRNESLELGPAQRFALMTLARFRSSALDDLLEEFVTSSLSEGGMGRNDATYGEIDWEAFAKFIKDVLEALGPFIQIILALFL